MKHKYKEFALIKSADDAGTISGYFSTYDRIPDSYGDVIAKGAFTETIRKRKESGHPFPLCWNHDVNQIIGFVDPNDIEDTDKGPLMKEASFLIPCLRRRSASSSRAAWSISFRLLMTCLRQARSNWKTASRRTSSRRSSCSRSRSFRYRESAGRGDGH